MMTMITKHRQKFKIAVAVAAAVNIVLLLLAFFVAVWWRISFFTGIEIAFRIIIILTGVATLPAGIYFLMKQKNKYQIFCDIYDDPVNPKHTTKIMFYSFIKYCALIFVLIIAAYGIFIYPMIIISLYILLHVPAYIKLWKYHGYSVPLLMIITGVMIAVSIILSPFVRTGVWMVIDAFLRFSNI